MLDQDKWMNEMMGMAVAGNLLNMAKLCFEMGVRTMDAFEQQASKTVEMAMSGATATQTETAKALEGWLVAVKQARKMYVDAIEMGLGSLEIDVAPKAEVQAKASPGKARSKKASPKKTTSKEKAAKKTVSRKKKKQP